MNRPRLIVTPESHRSGLGSVSWEQRRQMTAAQLIELMGPLHCQHPDFKERPRSLLPMPNLAGKQPVMQGYDVNFWRLIRQAIRFAMA